MPREAMVASNRTTGGGERGVLYGEPEAPSTTYAAPDWSHAWTRTASPGPLVFHVKRVQRDRRYSPREPIGIHRVDAQEAVSAPIAFDLRRSDSGDAPPRSASDTWLGRAAGQTSLHSMVLGGTAHGGRPGVRDRGTLGQDRDAQLAERARAGVSRETEAHRRPRGLPMPLLFRGVRPGPLTINASSVDESASSASMATARASHRPRRNPLMGRRPSTSARATVRSGGLPGQHAVPRRWQCSCPAQPRRRPASDRLTPSVVATTSPSAEAESRSSR